MQSVSLIWGIVALSGMLVGFVPLFGALNWLLIPFAVIGAIISAIAIGTTPAEANKGQGIAGLISCGIAAIFGLIRLVVGFGIV